MNLVKHNIGIAFNLEGSAICHSIWNNEKLVITDFWVGKQGKDYSPVSLITVLESLDNIVSKWNQEQKNNLFFYCPNKLVRMSLQNWMESALNPSRVRILEPIAPPSDSAVWMASELHDGRLAVTDSVDLDLVKSAFSQIGEDEQGRAVGTPEALALLYGVGEPIYRRVSRQEKIIFSSVSELLSS